MSETGQTAPAPITVPAFAAGAGIPTLALDRLRDAGWDRYEDDRGNVTYVSLDGCARAEFGPETPRYLLFGALWEFAYTDPNPYAKNRKSWKASFGDEVPAEAIAAFIEALTDPNGLDFDR